MSVDNSLKAQINADVKKAMIARDKPLVTVLQSLKSAILYKEVEAGKREEGLEESAVVAVLKKEKKSRQDAYTMYADAGESDRAKEEEYQMGVISGYLPEELSETDTIKLVEKIIDELSIETLEMKHTGQVIGKIKASGAEVDSGVVSKVVKGMIG